MGNNYWEPLHVRLERDHKKNPNTQRKRKKKDDEVSLKVLKDRLKSVLDTKTRYQKWAERQLAINYDDRPFWRKEVLKLEIRAVDLKNKIEKKGEKNVS